jgi:hypothetical protein
MMSLTTMAESAWHLAAHILLLPAAVVGIAYLLLRAMRTIHLRQEKNRSPPPGGIGSWCRGVVGAETLSFLADNSSGRGFYHFVHTRALRYGACFRTTLFARTHVFLLSSAARGAASHLLAADPPHFAKRYVRTVADLLGEHSLLCTSHDTHRRMRRAVAGLFASASTAAFVATFDRLITSQLLLANGCKDQVVVLDVALDVTFRAICEMLIGPQDDARKLDQLQSDVMDVTQAMLAVPLKLPGTRFYRGLQVPSYPLPSFSIFLYVFTVLLFQIAVKTLSENRLIYTVYEKDDLDKIVTKSLNIAFCAELLFVSGKEKDHGCSEARNIHEETEWPETGSSR